MNKVTSEVIPNLDDVKAVALDIAGLNTADDSQARCAEVIWLLLLRGYQLYLFSSTGDDFSREDFQHPKLRFLTEPLPPLPKYPLLEGEYCLWVTNHAPLERWLDEHHRLRMCIGGKEQPGIRRLAAIDELVVALNPLNSVMANTISQLSQLKERFSQRAIIVGIGGPAISDLQQFTLLLQSALQDANLPMVELLDISSLTPNAEVLHAKQLPKNAAWQTPEGGSWLTDQLLKPLQKGETIFLKTPPPLLPTAMAEQFPLYLHPETILLLLAEMVFVQPLQPLLDVRLLLELPPEELARRLYEIPPHESFDPSFTQQFLQNEGGQYQHYLRHHQVQKLQPMLINAQFIIPNP